MYQAGQPQRSTLSSGAVSPHQARRTLCATEISPLSGNLFAIPNMFWGPNLHEPIWIKGFWRYR